MYDLWYLSQTKYQNNWKSFKEQFPHARRKVVNDSFEQSLYECAQESFTSFFYTVSDNCILKSHIDFNWKPTEYELQYIHTWPTNRSLFFDYDSVTLWPKDLILSNHLDFKTILQNKVKQHIDNVLVYYDIFFISYEEETADKNWELFNKRFPHARRIDKVKGISNAHKTCANLSNTDMFYTVDADSQILDNWDFTFVPPLYDRDYIHIWYSKNPINNLEYGYGAVKLWPTDKVFFFNQSFLDFTTTVGKIKIMPDVINITNFNTSPYNTWKSAFRECIKLSLNIEKNPNDIESINRLNVWQNVFNPVPFSEWAKHGAIDAVQWLKENQNIQAINDFDWLKHYFINRYS